MNEDKLLFLRMWLKAPLKIASFSPSSPAVGRAFARHVDPKAEHPVLELGGGTGSITEQLLAAGLAAEKLIVIEQAPELCAVLRRRFPEVRVIEGDAEDLGALLDGIGVARLSLVVSSLPIIWFPLAGQRAVVEAAFARMDRGGQLLQFSNQLASPLPKRKLGLRGQLLDFVWRNLPPATTWSYRREQAQPR